MRAKLSSWTSGACGPADLVAIPSARLAMGQVSSPVDLFIIVKGSTIVTVHFFARFEPRPGKDAEFRQELLRVIDPTRQEDGCVGIEIFESLQEPLTFAIHSAWLDESAFDRHAEL